MPQNTVHAVCETRQQPLTCSSSQPGPSFTGDKAAAAIGPRAPQLEPTGPPADPLRNPWEERQTLIASASVQGSRFDEALFDTGCSHTVLARAAYDLLENKPPIGPVNNREPLYGVGGGQVEIEGVIAARVSFFGHELSHPVL